MLYKYYTTPIGTMRITIVGDEIVAGELCNDAFQEEQKLDLSAQRYVLRGTVFQHKVWDAVRTIERGSVMTYQELAQAIGHPTAWRAVANAVGKNPLTYLIACHRVVRSDGTLGGYRWGVEKKRALLAIEALDR